MFASRVRNDVTSWLPLKRYIAIWFNPAYAVRISTDAMELISNRISRLVYIVVSLVPTFHDGSPFP